MYSYVYLLKALIPILYGTTQKSMTSLIHHHIRKHASDD